MSVEGPSLEDLKITFAKQLSVIIVVVAEMSERSTKKNVIDNFISSSYTSLKPSHTYIRSSCLYYSNEPIFLTLFNNF